MKCSQYACRTCLVLLFFGVVICGIIAQEEASNIDIVIDENENAGVVNSINARAGLIIIYGSANAADRDANQVRSIAVMEILGIGITMPVFEQLITFEPALDFGLIDLRFDGSNSDDNSLNTPIPRNFFNPRNNSYTSTLVLMLSLPIEFQFSFDQYVFVGFGISPTITFRVAVSGTDQQEISDISSYYTDGGRFFTPEAYVKIGYRFSDVHINALVRGLWPLYNAWNTNGLPLLHDLYLIGNIQFQFAL